MGIIEGTPKYIIGVLLSGWGFVCMYLFGGSLVTLWNTIDKLSSGKFIDAFIEYYIYSALPPTSIEHVIGYAVLGAIIAGGLWFVGMLRFGASL